MSTKSNRQPNNHWLNRDFIFIVYNIILHSNHNLNKFHINGTLQSLTNHSLQQK